MSDNKTGDYRQCPHCGGNAVMTICSKLPDADLEFQVFKCLSCQADTTRTVDTNGNEVLRAAVRPPDPAP